MDVKIRTREQALWYLAGMIDGEGHIGFYDEDGTGRSIWQTKKIVIASTDQVLIDACERCCQILKYHHRFYTGPNRHVNSRPLHRINITTQETLQRAAKELPIQHPQKRRTLQAMAASYLSKSAPYKTRT